MRIWNNHSSDDGSIHCIGNGDILVYEQGPNITNFFGTPYSIPSFLQMVAGYAGDDIRAVSVREKGTAIWQHCIDIDKKFAGNMTDYVLPDCSVFIRDADMVQAICFSILPSPGIKVHDLGKYFSYLSEDASSVQLTIPKGTTFFTSEPTPWEVNMVVTVSGSAQLMCSDHEGVTICLYPGKSRIIFSSQAFYPDVIRNTETVLKESAGELLAASRKYWQDFSARRRDFTSMIPVDHPLRDSILDAIDSVSVLIKCQQSRSGGVAAGHYYNMAYVRDMSGTMRGLLALGYIEEARAILEYWWDKWSLFGNLYNAEGMGNNSARLLFINDEVEIPAYIILSCFIYYSYTGDEAFLRKVFPMMEWAFEVQLPHLIEGMTEFSCDETYIAGGTYPKYLMYHGSAESTLLFITGGQKLVDWVESQGLWPAGKIHEYREKVSYAREQYKSNFFIDGTLYANNPLREKAAGRPRFRFGFCDGHEINKKTLYLTWTERDSKGYFLCPQCRSSEMPDYPDPGKRCILNSINLVPLYIGSDLFTMAELESMVKPGIDLFNEKGMVPSNVEGSRSLGYDYGLMLYNMVRLNHPVKEQVLRKTLSLLDSTGAWVEYYDNGKPFNCRARPWESAINIEAVIEYIKTLK